MTDISPGISRPLGPERPYWAVCYNGGFMDHAEKKPCFWDLSIFQAPGKVHKPGVQSLYTILLKFLPRGVDKSFEQSNNTSRARSARRPEPTLTRMQRKFIPGHPGIWGCMRMPGTA